MIEHFSTRSMGLTDRVEFWNQLLGETYDGLVVDPLQSRFHAQMSRWRLGDMTMVWPKSAAAVVARRNPGTSCADGQKVLVHVVQSGECTLTQRGRTAHLKAGDMVLSAGEEFYRFDVGMDHQLLVVEMNRALLEDKVPHLDDMVARNISGKLATTRLLQNFLLSLWREGAANFDESLAKSYSSVLVELLATGLQQRSQSLTPSGNVLFERMKGVVAATMSDPGLTPSQLAAELGVSLRTLQSAASLAGTTPGSYIMQRRLDCAAQRLLMEPQTSITSIAFSSGFTDGAYFTRRFHERFGVSPSEYRQRH